MPSKLAVLFFCALFLPVVAQADEAATPAPGIAMHGTPKYTPGFSHFDYVNPDAPKGGELHLAEEGTFDSLNPFIIKGSAAPGVGEYVFQTLMTGSSDEAFSEYGLLAETIETPKDRSWVAFNLRKNARWSDGKPVTADDVVWSFHTLMEKGAPYYRGYYAGVKDVVAESPMRVKFTFKPGGSQELPLILGQFPILPKHFWEGKKFESSTTDIPVGSGPYKVKSFDSGKRITFERDKDWWGKDLPETKGMYNFDTIIIDSYRDPTALLQSFFAGNFDIRHENIAKAWFTEYDDKPPVKDGRIKKEEIHHDLPSGMQSFAFNIRRPLFSDPKVREALNYTFDFEWSNKQFAYGGYTRTKSYFDNSELASSGVPTGDELKILEQFRGQVPDDLFTKPFTLPKTSGSGNDMRQNLETAKKILEADGWKMGPSGLEKNGQPFKFEILIDQEAFERWVAPMVSNLKKLGIQANIRYVDASQYQKRLEDFDFDMTIHTFGESLSPGNEQRNFWTSEKADVHASANLIGIKNPVIDKLVDLVINAPDRDQLLTRTHALDRVLLWNYYVIPQWHLNAARVAYWNKFDRPSITPKYDPVALTTWWYDTEKAAKLSKVKPEASK
jgi:microcin C transport system substrate-binding protein